MGGPHLSRGGKKAPLHARGEESLSRERVAPHKRESPPRSLLFSQEKPPRAPLEAKTLRFKKRHASYGVCEPPLAPEVPPEKSVLN